MSLFIIIFQEGKYINEKKDRVKVMHIENFTKPLYQVFPTDLYFINFSFNKSFFLHWWFWLWAKEFLYRPKRIMDALKAAIIRYKLPLKFDNPTEGQGNCFPNVQ